MWMGIIMTRIVAKGNVRVVYSSWALVQTINLILIVTKWEKVQNLCHYTWG